MLDGELVSTGYSGWGSAKNDPQSERVAGWGPIPRGRWALGARFDSQTHGSVCFRLAPRTGTDTFGRNGFLIHGDSGNHAGCASHGCIVLDRIARLKIDVSDMRELEVV